MGQVEWRGEEAAVDLSVKEAVDIYLGDQGSMGEDGY